MSGERRLKMKQLRKVSFWAFLVMGILSLLMGGTAWQLAPAVAFLILAQQTIWGEKDYVVAIEVIAFIMLLVNLGIFAMYDTAFWLLALIAFGLDNKK